MHPAVIVQDLSKRFQRYHANRPLTFQEAVVAGLRRLRSTDYFWALQDINFTVMPGEMLGILGKNGAGKSTLLQLLGGIGHPDRGKIKVRGRIGALLDLGAGFHSDLTGRENVFVSGVVAGLTRRQVAQRFDSIVEFAELASFIDSPIRTYSTGMQMRLAFSVAVHTDPDILLIDEFLSVGDLAFQSKCLDRIAQFKAQGCAIILISHSAEQIQQLCDHALWLNKGQIVAYGEPDIIAGQYVAEMHTETERRTPMRPPQLTNAGVELRVNENRFGSLEAEITDVRLYPSSQLNAGDSLCVEIEYTSTQPIEAPILGVTISREDGTTCFDTTTEALGLALPMTQDKQQVTLRLDRLDLASGNYFVDVGIYEQNWTYAYDYHWHVYSLKIHSPIDQKGTLNPPHYWEIDSTLSSRHRRFNRSALGR